MATRTGKRKRIVILGGGFGGVYTAQCLLTCRLRTRRPDITLVSRSPYFEFKPLFIEALGGRLEPELARFRLNDLFERDACKIRIASVTGIDTKKNVVTTDDGEIEFDYLVIALGGGSVPVPKTRAASVYSLESVDECIRLRNRIDTLGRQPRSTRGKKPKARNTIAIIGAGPTGVEVATEIFHTLNAAEGADDNKESRSTIILIESAKRILPEWGEHLRARAESVLDECDVEVLTRTNVDRIGKSSITLKGGKTIATETVVWCGGLKGSPIYKSIGASLDKSGRLRVNTFLQVPGFENIYAMGDAINTQVFLDRVPQSAQAAYQQAKVIAYNILNEIQGKTLKHFRYFELGEVMPIGGRRAIARVLGVPLRGHLAWTLEKSIYVFRVPGLANKMKLLDAIAITPLEQRGEEYLEKRGW